MGCGCGGKKMAAPVGSVQRSAQVPIPPQIANGTFAKRQTVQSSPVPTSGVSNRMIRRTV